MKVLMINGSPRAKGNTSIALHEMEQVFAAEGIETEIIQVGIPTCMISVSIPSAAKTCSISCRAMDVFPFARGLPLIINTFINVLLPH